MKSDTRCYGRVIVLICAVPIKAQSTSSRIAEVQAGMLMAKPGAETQLFSVPKRTPESPRGSVEAGWLKSRSRSDLRGEMPVVVCLSLGELDATDFSAGMNA